MELETRETKITVDFLSYNQSAFSKKANLNETCLQSLHKLPLRSRIIFFFLYPCTLYLFTTCWMCSLSAYRPQQHRQPAGKRQRKAEENDKLFYAYLREPATTEKQRQSEPAS